MSSSSQIILRGGFYGGRVFALKGEAQAAEVGNFHEVYRYEPTGEHDAEGRAIFELKSVVTRPTRNMP